MEISKLQLHILCIIQLSVNIANANLVAEQNLADFLLNRTRYNPAIRPVAKYTDKLTVKHGLSLSQLIKLDEKSQIVTTSVLLKMKWHDMFLKWDPAMYGGITEFNVDVNLIWFPLISLFNNADDSLDAIATPRAIVRYDGSITAVMPRILKSTCKIKVKDFPFDRQNCELRFGSFQYEADKMDVQSVSQNILLNDFQLNGEWSLTEKPVKKGLVCHAFSNKLVFSQLSYQIQLVRKPLYYTVNFLIPCILIALLTILLFLVPPDTGEQMAVGVTILLSLAVFFLLLEAKMPETSDAVPLIGKYYACTIVQASLAVGAVCMVLCLHHHDPTDVPPWIQKFILGKLARILRIKTCKNNDDTNGKETMIGCLPLHKFFKKKETIKIRKEDENTVKIGRKHFLIWQAKAKAKRLRREKQEKEEDILILPNDETKLISLSNEDLGNIGTDKKMSCKVNANLKEKLHESKERSKKPIEDELENSCELMTERSRNGSLVDDTRVLIVSPKHHESNTEQRAASAQVNFLNKMTQMKDNVRKRFQRKEKIKQQVDETELIKRTLFKIKPAVDWQEADHQSVKLMADTIKETDSDDAKKGEWKEVGKVINYFMMWLYIASLFLTFFALFGSIVFRGD